MSLWCQNWPLRLATGTAGAGVDRSGRGVGRAHAAGGGRPRDAGRCGSHCSGAGVVQPCTQRCTAHTARWYCNGHRPPVQPGGGIPGRGQWSGIPPGEQEQIFTPFYRGDSSRPRGGTGLGLAIARAVVTAHQGWIRADTAPTGGAQIVCWIPLHPAAVRPEGNSWYNSPWQGHSAESAGRGPAGEG